METDLYGLLTLAFEEPLPLPLQAHLSKLMRQKSFRKNEIVLEQGKINTCLYYIERGLLRAYSTQDGIDETTWIKGEGEFAVAIPSFYDQTASDQSLHALENTDVFFITQSEFYNTLKSHLEFSYIAYRLQTAVLLEWNERLQKLKKLDMRHRFEWLAERHPNLLHRSPGIPDKYLASYLGMTPETFSKIKGSFYKLSDNSTNLNRKVS